MTREIPMHDVVRFREKRNDYCLCIPVINEGEKIRRQLRELNVLKLVDVVDVIVCDGGSTDDSLNEVFLKQVNVTCLLTKRDKGKLSAQLRMGYSYALDEGYVGIITVDGNGKDNMSAIPLFIEALKQGYDFVQGSRFVDGGKAINTPLSRHLALKCIHAPMISMASGFSYTDTTNGYRGYSRDMLLDPNIDIFRNVFDTYELLAYLSVRVPRLGYKVTEVPVERAYPLNEKIPTKISPLKGNMTLLHILWKASMHQYDPK